MSVDKITLTSKSLFLMQHCLRSPRSSKLSAQKAPDCLCQLLVLSVSALNVCSCFGEKLNNGMNRQIYNCNLMASFLKVRSYLVKYGLIKI